MQAGSTGHVSVMVEEVLEFLDAAGAPGKEVIASRRAQFAALLLSLENVHGFPALPSREHQAALEVTG